MKPARIVATLLEDDLDPKEFAASHLPDAPTEAGQLTDATGRNIGRRASYGIFNLKSYTRRHLAVQINVQLLPSGAADLEIVFANGARFRQAWDRTDMLGINLRQAGIIGVPIFVNGRFAGPLSYSSEKLGF